MPASRSNALKGLTLLCLLAALCRPAALHAQAERSAECGLRRTPAQAAQWRAWLDGATLRDPGAVSGPTASAASWRGIDLPVRHHVVRSADGLGGLPAEACAAILDTLNHFFAPAGIRFYACGPVQEIRSDAFYRLSTLDEEALCGPHDQPGVINLYYVDELLMGPMGICGYAYFPGGKDRILLDADCAVNGNTVVHEMGHYLGLEHTHGPDQGFPELVSGENCAAAGDGLCGTPADPGLSYLTVSSGCVYTGTQRDADGLDYRPDTRNFMSYSRLGCRRSFSPDQYDRMALVARVARSGLSCACAPPNALSSAVREDRARLAWSGPDGARFQLAGGPAGGPQGLLATGRAERTLDGLRPSTTYAWRVRARCADGSETPFSWPDTFRTPAPRQAAAPAEGTGLRALAPNPALDRVRVTWRQPEAGLLELRLVSAGGTTVARATRLAEAGTTTLEWVFGEQPEGWYVLSLRGRGATERRALRVGKP